MNNFTTITIYQATNSLEIKTKQKPELKELKNILDNIEEYISITKKKFFINLSNNISFDKDSKIFLQDHLIPTLIKKGLNTGAFVLPQDTFEKLDWKNSLSKLRRENGKFLVKVFNEENSARAWMNN